jgi:hypothetical protein
LKFTILINHRQFSRAGSQHSPISSTTTLTAFSTIIIAEQIISSQGSGEDQGGNEKKKKFFRVEIKNFLSSRKGRFWA